MESSYAGRGSEMIAHSGARRIRGLAKMPPVTCMALSMETAVSITGAAVLARTVSYIMTSLHQMTRVTALTFVSCSGRGRARNPREDNNTIAAIYGSDTAWG